MQNLFVIVNEIPTHNVIAPGVLYYRAYSPENATPAATAEANPHWIGAHRAAQHKIWAGYFSGLAEDIAVVATAASVVPAHITVVPHHDAGHNVLTPGRLYYRHRAGDAFVSPPVQPATNVNFIAKHRPTHYRPFRTGSRDFNEGQGVNIPGPPIPTQGTSPVVPTTAAPSVPLVPTMMGNQQEWTRQIAQASNRNTQRATNVTLDVTLTHSATTTTITDARISAFSAITPAMAMTASGAAAIAAGIYVDTLKTGSAVIHHASNAATDQKIRFVIQGA